MITLQIAKPIHVKLPRVYRYMQQEFIDRFFAEGVLRVSSFERFRSYPDEIRGDKSEGGGSITGKGSEGQFQFHLMTKVGENGYMLSTSLEESEEIRTDFKTDSYFIIADPLSFAAAISNALLGNAQVYIGFCNYQPHRIIEKEIPEMSAKDFTDEKGNFIIGGPGMAGRINQLVGNGIDLMFLKEQKYQNQAEFRFVWTINTAHYEMRQHVDLICKEAIQFCEKKKEI